MRNIAFVSSAGNLLSWDQECGMPAKALPYRAEQLAFLSGWAHRQFTDPDVGRWLAECEEHPFEGDLIRQSNVREWRRSYDRQTRLPSDLVEELERARSLARDAWIGARARSEFALFRPHLERILGLTLRMAECWGYEQSPYDALLEEYEPGARTQTLKVLFEELRPPMVALAAQAAERARETPSNILDGDYPVSQQQALNREVAQAFGFDFDAGRIDTTAHPFCTGIGPGDCRLTTRYNERDFTQSLYGVIHEAGHGLYEQGLPGQQFGLPSGSAVSLGIHESQSRLWENHVGRSSTFWECWHERACHWLPALKAFSPEQITQAVNRVAPSFIRVEADELTYDLHILLRFEIERALVEGQLDVKDVPAFWNERFEKLFELKVPNDAQGCLQDIHWSLGSLGYFPTYTLGNLNASQLMRQAFRDCPTLKADLGSGQYQRLLAWLREHVHRLGQQYRSQDVMKHATGQTTQVRVHIEYLQEKFGSATGPRPSSPA